MESETSQEKRRAVGLLNLMRDKIEGCKNRGKKGRHLLPRLVQKLEGRSVTGKNIKED